MNAARKYIATTDVDVQAMLKKRAPVRARFFDGCFKIECAFAHT